MHARVGACAHTHTHTHKCTRTRAGMHGRRTTLTHACSRPNTPRAFIHDATATRGRGVCCGRAARAGSTAGMSALTCWSGGSPSPNKCLSMAQDPPPCHRRAGTARLSTRSWPTHLECRFTIRLCANSRNTLPQTHARPSALQRRQASAVLTQCRWTKRSWRSCKPRCGRWRHARPAARARQPRCAAPCPVHRLPPSAPRAHSAAARAGGGAPGPMRSLRAGALPFAVRHLTVRAHAAPRAALAPATCASPRCRCEREARVPCAGRRRPSTRRPAPTTSGCRCLRYAWRAVHALCAPALAPGHSHSRARALHARSVPDGAADALSAHRERLRAATGIRLQHELRHADVRGARLPGRPPRLAAAAHAPFSPSFSRSPRPRCLAHQPDMDGGWSSSRATGILWVGARRLRPPVHNMLGRNLPAHAAAMQPQSRRADDEGGVSWCGLLRVTAHVSAGTRCLALALCSLCPARGRSARTCSGGV